MPEPYKPVFINLDQIHEPTEQEKQMHNDASEIMQTQASVEALETMQREAS